MSESVGSDGVSTITSQRPRMDVVCVIDIHLQDHLNHRKRALEEIKQACTLVSANLHQIQVCKLNLSDMKEIIFKPQIKH